MNIKTILIIKHIYSMVCGLFSKYINIPLQYNMMPITIVWLKMIVVAVNKAWLGSNIDVTAVGQQFRCFAPTNCPKIRTTFFKTVRTFMKYNHFLLHTNTTHSDCSIMFRFSYFLIGKSTSSVRLYLYKPAQNASESALSDPTWFNRFSPLRRKLHTSL